MKRVRSLTQQDAEQLRTMELLRLDMLFGMAGPKAAAGHVDAMNTLLKITESRRKLLGLDAPVQLQIQQGIQQGLQSELSNVLEFLQNSVSASAYGEFVTAIAAIEASAAAAETN